MSTILGDERPIVSVSESPANDESGTWTVGTIGITKIEAYGEQGPHCYIPFVRIYRGDHLLSRLPALGLYIYYGPNAEEAA